MYFLSPRLGWKISRVVIVSLLMLIVADSAPLLHADFSPPTVQAQHAFVGDPLFGLDSQEGTVFAIKPDERTPMASTTKIVTLHIAVDFILGKKHSSYFTNLFDEVTISPFAAGIGGSSMKDVNNVPLQAGEKVRFDNLLRGMMYPSGNNAAYAVAEHLAGDWQTFVELMNDETLLGEVSPQGLPDTHFMNPNGFDNPDHYTTARELAKIWMHAYQDDYFKQVVGFAGTYSFQTQLPENLGGGTKQYSYCWGPPPGCFGSLYPTIGWEGVKGGSSTGCGTAFNPPNGIGCVVLSAHRIGRQLVMAFMQGADSADIFKMLDYGFAKLFHPDLRDTALNVNQWRDHDLQCLSNGRAVSTGLSGNFGLKMITWNVNVDSSQITKLGENSETAAQLNTTGLPVSVDVKTLALGNDRILVARKIGPPLLLLGAGTGSGSGTISLSLWGISGTGLPSILVKNVQAGVGSSIQLLPVDQNHFMTVYVNSDGKLVFKYWAVVVTPTAVRFAKPITEINIISSVTEESIPLVGTVDEVAVASFDFSGYFLTTTRNDLGFVGNQVWRLNSTSGEVKYVQSINLGGVIGSMISAIRIPVVTGSDEIVTWEYFATAFRWQTGSMRIMYTRANFDLSGNLLGFTLVGDTLPTGDLIVESPSLAPLGSSGLIAAIRDSNGKQRLVVWESRRNADDSISPFRVSEHEVAGADARSVDICGLPTTHSEGDFSSASLVPSGLCSGCEQVRAWRIGDRP